MANAIQAEADMLYRSEWASWYGSDIFIEKYKGLAAKYAGYLSYDNGKNLVNLFYSKGDAPEVIATTTFSYGFDPRKYTIDTTKRPFNPQERELYTIRKAAVDIMKTDTTFKYYKNTNLNPVPAIYKNKKVVYVLTGPTSNGSVLFGNDYRINFDNSNFLTGITKLHNTLIPIQYTNNKTDSSKNQTAAIHSHLKGKDEFITATDICTLRLYGKFTTWKTHYVISPTHVSIWDIKKETLVILTREAWDRISASQENGETKKD